MHKVDDPDCYSILDMLDTYRYSPSNYEFLLEYYDAGYSAYDIFTQTSNPCTTTAATGYTQIRTGISNSYRTGLARSSSTNDCFLDMSNTNGSWWTAVGIFKHHEGGIPGPEPSVIHDCALWLRIA